MVSIQAAILLRKWLDQKPFLAQYFYNILSLSFSFSTLI